MNSLHKWFYSLLMAFTSSSSSWSLPSSSKSISVQEMHLVQSLPVHESFVCPGGLQVDLVDPARLLIGICTSSIAEKSGALATLPIENISTYPSVIVGDPTVDSPIPGDWDDKIVVKPQYLHQHNDRERVLFVDDNSCVRELHRVNYIITTVIGKGTCGKSSLDLPGTVTSKFVSGLAYDESTNILYLAVIHDLSIFQGLYVYIKTDNQTFTGTRVLSMFEMTSHASPSARQLLIYSGHLWQKVRFGINRYRLDKLDQTGLNAYDNNTIIRFLSSPGSNAIIDPTAIYKYMDDDVKLGTSGADLSISPDNETLLIADIIQSNLFLLNTTNGDLSSVCGKIDAVQNCTFGEITTAVWLNANKIIAYDNSSHQFLVIHIADSTSEIGIPISTNKSVERNDTTSEMYAWNFTDNFEDFDDFNGTDVESGGNQSVTTTGILTGSWRSNEVTSEHSNAGRSTLSYEDLVFKRMVRAMIVILSIVGTATLIISVLGVYFCVNSCLRKRRRSVVRPYYL